MKIQIASDLHLEFIRPKISRQIEPVEGADLLVIAGDIHRGTQAFQAFANWPVPVVYVAGNHEFYNGIYENILAELRRLGRVQSKLQSAQDDVLIAECSYTHFLEQDEVVIQGVRFLGTMLWTDYELYENAKLAMSVAANSMNDHRVISLSGGGNFEPKHALLAHKKSRDWLLKKLDEPFDGKTVVVTHHGPHHKSIHSKYVGNALSPAFASNLTQLMGKADLWIHGHTHSSLDYVVKGTRVIANPRGYPVDPEYFRFENPDFDPNLVVEIGS